MPPFESYKEYWARRMNEKELWARLFRTCDGTLCAECCFTCRNLRECFSAMGIAEYCKARETLNWDKGKKCGKYSVYQDERERVRSLKSRT